jgi:hypothetical protein
MFHVKQFWRLIQLADPEKTFPPQNILHIRFAFAKLPPQKHGH